MLALRFIKAISILLPTLAFAGGNDLYIDQVGDNVNIYVNQRGENNQLKGKSTVNAPISGDGNTVIVHQGFVGNNLLELSVNGKYNDVLVGQEKGISGTIASGSVSVTNDTNSIGEHTGVIDISGDYNSATIVQRNNNSSNAGHTSSIIITNGDSNTVSTLQTGTGGTAGHNAYVHVKDGRDGNNVDVFQNSDTADHSATVSVYSNNNNIDINQTGTSQNKTYVLFSADSTGPTDFTLNQNGGDTYGSTSYITQKCLNPSGCSVSVSQ